MEAHDFRVSFTPLAGVLFTVPSRYCALSVTACSLPWTVVSPASDRVLRARPYSGNSRRSVVDGYATLTRCGAAFQTALPTQGGPAGARQRPVTIPTTPHDQRLAPWQSHGLGSTRFVRHYYGCGSLFLRLLRCFSWPGAPCTKCSARQRRAGCPIRRSRDHSLQAAPPRLSERCPVLHRHAAPGHPSCAHRVFPTHWSSVGQGRVSRNNQNMQLVKCSGATHLRT
jgi:hypothetical protein